MLNPHFSFLASYLFFCEAETEHHLPFECAVDKRTCSDISEVVKHTRTDLESVAQCQLSNKKFSATNMILAHGTSVGAMETENFLMSQWCVWNMDKYGDLIEENYPNVEKLEYVLPLGHYRCALSDDKRSGQISCFCKRVQG